MSSQKDQALLQLSSADLPATVMRTGVRILMMADGFGRVRLTKAEAMAACETESLGTMRSHLTKLASAGVIHYSTNERVYVDFLAFFDDGSRAERANHDAERSNYDAERASDEAPDADFDTENEPRALSARKTALSDQITTLSARNSVVAHRSRVVRVELSNDLTNTDQITQLNPEPPTDPAQRWIFRLLTDPEIDISPEKALDCARLHTPIYALRYVSNWWRKRDTLDPGALVWRMMNFQKSRPGPVWSGFLETELYRRHYPLSFAQLRKRAYDPDPPPLERWIKQLPPPVEADEEAEP